MRPPATLPAPLRAIGARLPQWPPAFALAEMLNLALGRLLPRDALAPLAGKTVCIEVADAGLALYVRMEEDGFRPWRGAPRADLRIRAAAADYVALALRHADPDALFFARRLSMEGDTELGLVIKNTLDAVDVPAALRGMLALPGARNRRTHA